MCVCGVGVGGEREDFPPDGEILFCSGDPVKVTSSREATRKSHKLFPFVKKCVKYYSGLTHLPWHFQF